MLVNRHTLARASRPPWAPAHEEVQGGQAEHMNEPATWYAKAVRYVSACHRQQQPSPDATVSHTTSHSPTWEVLQALPQRRLVLCVDLSRHAGRINLLSPEVQGQCAGVGLGSSGTGACWRQRCRALAAGASWEWQAHKVVQSGKQTRVEQINTHR